MKEQDRKYLELSLQRLKRWLPYETGSMMRMYEEEIFSCSVETIAGQYHACLFSYPLKEIPAEQIVLLVYDEQDRIIADTNAYHMSVRELLTSVPVYDYLSEESDWMYLEHYVLSGTMFEELPYPYCLTGQDTQEEGEVLIYGNAYVTKAYRRQGIYRTMLEMMRDHAVRNVEAETTVYSVLSMDPDVACYGPDSTDVPYIYSFEKDEPVRMTNRTIAEHTGFEALRLEEDHPEENTDGTKLWFCVRRETVLIRETDYLE